MAESNLKNAEWAMRVGIFLTFFGHGIFAVQQKTKFLEMLTAMTGGLISGPAAGTTMLIIGVVDILVAIAILFKPLRILLIWAALWGFATAVARPVAGDPIWDFVERGANFCLPLALLYLRGLPKNAKEWLE